MTALVCTISLACGGAPAASSTASSGASKTAAAAGGAKSLAVAARVPGQPPRSAVVLSGSYFSYPNRSGAEKVAIRNRVINTINSTWGKYTTASGDVRRGKILMTTWSFNDWAVREALVNAAKRGTTVRIIAAKSINTKENYRPWFSLRTALNKTTRGWARVDPTNIAKMCSGACRGGGGTPHSKYFLFDDTGKGHQRNVVVQTSMNLTAFAYKGQWNQATVMKSAKIFSHFRNVFDQSLKDRSRGSNAYVRATAGSVTDIFYPGGGPTRDPVMSALNRVSCIGARSGGTNGRTRVRVINYAIHDTRGNRIAKKLRSLWSRGCDVRIIYSVSSRPVLKILRSHSGRGPIPMKQSVIRNRKGEIVKYNHSKWLAISGRYGSSRGTWTAHAGSANWSDIAYRSDEQMQQFFGFSRTKRFFTTFSKTWSQSTSKPPRFGRVTAGNRTLAPEQEAALEQEALEDVPEQPTFGEGEYKYMLEGG
jgi:hypothetical protein